MSNEGGSSTNPAPGLGGSSLLPPRRRPSPKSRDSNMKRSRPKSGDDLVRLGTDVANNRVKETDVVCSPLVPPLHQLPTEPIATYMEKIKVASASPKDCPAEFSVKTSMDEDGLYIHKRPIRGLGPGNPLAIGGTVFHHALLYYKANGKVHGLDYGPSNMQDVTDNIMEEADARPVLMNSGSEVEVPLEDNLPFLQVRTSLHALEDRVVQEAMAFCSAKKYHVIHNNCIHACDFLVRILTGGLVRSAPLIYDAICGEFPAVDPPMLMMLPLLMQKTWHQVCDGSGLMTEFINTHSFPPLISGDDNQSSIGGPAKRREQALPTKPGLEAVPHSGREATALLVADTVTERCPNKTSEAQGDLLNNLGHDSSQFNDIQFWRNQPDPSLVPDDA